MDPVVGQCIIIATLLGGIGALYVIVFGQQSIFEVIHSFRSRRIWQVEPTYLPSGTSRSVFEPARLELGAYDSEKVLRELERLQRLFQNEKPIPSLTESTSFGMHPFDAAENLLLKAEAFLYLGDKRAVSLFHEVIDLLEPFNPQTGDELQKKEHFIGRAYNGIGYFFTRVKDFSRAEREYREKALPRLRNSASRSAFAHSLKNLAYLYGLQGKLVPAEILCQEAIEIFQKEKDSPGALGVAYSLNTLGLINVEGRQHQIGRTRCQKALQSFELLKENRGIGLACIGVGYSLRRLATRDVYSSRESQKLLSDALVYLDRAAYIFDKVIKEPFRSIEAYSELGCTYRDKARVLRKLSSRLAEIRKLEEKAVENLLVSSAISEEKGFAMEKADALEDIAQVYFQQSNYQAALQKLQDAEFIIPKEYFISESAGIPKLSDPVTPFWALLGKTALLRGQIEFERGLSKDAYKWWTYAGAYFDLYAPTTTLTNYAVRSVYSNLHNLGVGQLEEWKKVADKVGQDCHIPQPKLREILDDIFGVIGDSNVSSPLQNALA